MICHSCGSALEENVKFCGNCGVPVEVPAPFEEAAVAVGAPAQTTAAPVPPTPLYEPVAATPAPTAKKPRSVAKTVWSIVLSIFLYIFLFATIVLFCCRSILDSGTVKRFLDQVDADDLIVWMDLDFESVGITADELRDIYEKTDIKEFVGDTVDNFFDNLLYGAKIEKITADDIVTLLSDNADEIERISGYRISDYEDIERYFEEGDGKEILDALSGGWPEFLKTVLPDAAHAVSILELVSAALLVGTIVMLVLSLAMALLVFLVRSWDADAFCYVGVVSVLSALPLLIVGAFGPLFAVSFGNWESIFVTLLESILGGVFGTALTFTLIGVLLIAVYIVIRVIKRRKQRVS